MKSIRETMKKIRELIAVNQLVLYLAMFILVFLLFLLIQDHASFMDPDSFYHLKMIKLIAQSGPVINFPWLQFTVLKNYYIDQHFLYHVFGIPFVRLLGDFAGYKFYTVVLNTILILFFYWFFKKEKVKYAEIFILLLLASQGFLFRVSLAKASSFSLLFLFTGIYFLLKRKVWPLFILSWLYVWAYGGFILIWVMTGFFIIAESIFQLAQNWSQIKGWKNKFVLFLKKLFAWPNWKLIIATISGVVGGLILNPYFPKNLYFIWEQLVQIGLINYLGKVNVGGEWYPYSWSELLINGGAIFIYFVIVLAIFFITIRKQNSKSLFFMLATLFFIIFTLKSKRYVEYLMPFVAFFTALTSGYALAGASLFEKFESIKKLNKIFGYACYTLAVVAIIFTPLIMARDVKNVYDSFRGGIPLEKYAGVGAYLLAHSQPGEIVMQTDWSDFPMLFYQDDRNYYIVGLDPTFMYNYSPKLYNLFADITMAKIRNDIAKLVKDNFQASYFEVNKDRGQLHQLLQADPGFVKVYEDKEVWLYKLK